MTESRLPLSTRLFYGFGAVAYGVKDNGFSYFLLLYYNQALGLPGPTAGLALLIALAFDAVSDPVVGHLSDNLHSRWGRRHPFMYAAALPVAIAYFLIWNPPADLSDTALFVHLVCTAVAVRLFVTLYEVPSTALVAELTQDYDERTTLLSYRAFFGWYGGLLVAVLAYAVFLTEGPDGRSGFVNPDGYRAYGTFAAGLIFLSILVSAVGLHRHIPRLRQPPPPRPFSFRGTFADIRESLANRNFLVLLMAGIFAALGGGVGTNLYNYMNTYFWEFTPSQVSVITTCQFGSAFLAFLFGPLISRRIGKKPAAIIVYVTAFTMLFLPYGLRLAGLFFPNGHPVLLPFMAVWGMLDVALLVMAGFFIGSMLADVVEESELRTGRRSEGLFFSARTFAMKMTSAGGIFIAGFAIELIGLSSDAQPGQVPDETVFRLGLLYGPILVLFYLAAIAWIAFYRIDRTAHAANLAALDAEPPAGPRPAAP